jgi:hypothetical protein
MQVLARTLLQDKVNKQSSRFGLDPDRGSPERSGSIFSSPAQTDMVRAGNVGFPTSIDWIHMRCAAEWR